MIKHFSPPLPPQALIYFAVSKKGEAPIDGVTDANPEGLTSTCGKWAGEFKERLAKGGLTCHELPEDRCKPLTPFDHITTATTATASWPSGFT